MCGLFSPQLYDAFGLHEYAGFDAKLQDFSARSCERYPEACQIVIGSLCGRNPRGNIANEILPSMMHHLPAGTSVHNMKHWGQVYTWVQLDMYFMCIFQQLGKL